MLNSLDTYRIAAREAVLLIIDPQRSFTQGVRMQSIGKGASVESAINQMTAAGVQVVRRVKWH